VNLCLAFERTLFVAEESNWEDRRDIMQKAAFSTGWSHGAPGIGMVRHALIACGLDSPELRVELDLALDCTVAKGFGRAAHLAMGDFGNMELLLRMSRMTPHLINQALARVTTIRGPGYLGGLAGVGHQCLRLLYPNLVPSLLLGEVMAVPQA
jgi:lantibiotic modifying enzyme